MSQHPRPYGLGLSPNHMRFEQPSRSYAPAPAANLPASTPNSTPSLKDIATNMSLAQSLFQYNAMGIPGLGRSTASAMPNGYPVPSAMDNPLLTAGTPQAPPGLASWAQQPSHVASRLTVFPSGIPSVANEAELSSAKSPLRPTQSGSQFSVGIDAEEGELSEGQFEDLYEPDQPTNHMGSSMSVPTKPNKSRPAQPEDALGTEFYDDGEEEEGEIGSAVVANADRGRGRSRSYSPCLSPTEIANNSPRVQRAPQNQAPNSASRPLHTKPIETVTAIPSTLPGLEKTTDSQPTGPLGAGPTNGTMPQRPALRPSTSFRSLQEAKKEAQKIILGLLPMGVKYGQYLQEGFDETVIKGLFGDLRLDTSKNTPSSPQTAAEQTFPATTKSQPLRATQSGLGALHGKEKEKAKSTPVSPKQPSGKSEERKDRIARLLALKAAKGPSVVSGTPMPSPLAMKSGNRASAESATEFTEAVPTSAAVPTLTSARPRTEKDLLLQQKLAALEKTRQAQAQNLAQEKAKSGQDDDQDISRMTPVQPAQKSVGTPQDRASGVAAAADPPPSGPIPKTVQVIPQPTPAAEAPTSQPTQPTQPIPELPVQPSPGHPSRPLNKRKRPVASDFVEYVTTVGPPKRQFGQMRHETSLIIDVTDDDDESTDQEMDIDTDSPLDHPSSAMPTPHGVTGPSIRDFPPLSDRNGSQQRQLLNPTFLDKRKKGKKVVDLQEKEKAIQEMKRRIAEAEARRKAKPSASVGQRTPNEATSCTPEPKPAQGLPTPTHATNLPPNRSMSSPVPTTSGYAMPASETSQNLSTVRPVTLTASPNTETKTQTTSLAESRHQIWQSKVRELTDKSNARSGRILSVELPQVDERLEEKRSRLEQLREQQKMLEAELERDLAQKRLLTTELSDYVPSENPQALPSGSNVSNEEAPSVEHRGTDPSLHRVLGVRNALPSPDLAAPEIEMVKKHEPSNEEVPAQPAHPAEEAAVVNGPPAELQPLRDEASPVREMAGAIMIDAPDHPTSTVDGGAHPFREANMTQSTNVNRQTEDTDVVMQEPDHMVKSRDDGEPHDGSEVYETAEAPEDSSESPVSTNPSDDVTGSVSHTDAPVPTPTPLISNAASHPGADSREIEAEVVSRQQVVVREEAAAARTQITSKRRSSFIPYQSPLHQFRAFRFHPDYQDTVAGGLKSLTYSHKIEPQKPLCPSELRGEACDEHCEFQHLRSMAAEDDQILVELGRAEDFGADKDRFIQGLRKVLHVFRDQNVRDFDTIARGIIDFRHQFIGDKTKVLPLHGVSI